MSKIGNENLYKEAAEQWLKENPNKTLADCPQKEKVTLPTGKIISLGTFIAKIRLIYRTMQEGKHYGRCKDLTEEQIKWWTDHGIDWGKKINGKKNATIKSDKEIIEKYTSIMSGNREKAKKVVQCLTNLKEKNKRENGT